MNKFILAVTLFQFVLSSSSARIIYVKNSFLGIAGSGTQFDPYGDLQNALNQAADGDTLLLQPGVFSARPQPFAENLCGNCEVHSTPVQASRGFLIENKGLIIIGAGPDTTTLITNAGYGVLFLNSRGSEIANLSITRGARDPDSNATNAGLVAKFSTLTVRNVHIRDNTDRLDSLVVGIGGIFGREESELTIRGCQIDNNGWDGIALYRGATALIEDNLIRDGRGAGIGITWDASAIVQRNRISGYWKGIGAFGASRAIVSNNLVKDCLGWGIIATGDAYLDACNNNVIHNGNCGLAIWSETCRGRFLNNIVVQNGWKDQWVAPQVGFWNSGKAENFIIAGNDVWDNVKGNYENMPDLTGIDGNISADPKFFPGNNFHLSADSPCSNTGSPLLSEGNGSISDMGMYGGPGAR